MNINLQSLNNWKTYALVILVLFIVLSLYKPVSDLFGWDKQEISSAYQQSSVNGTFKGNVREFDVIGSNFMFQPGLMRVKKGETVKIVFHNIEGLHDFRIDELNIATEFLDQNNTQTVTFVASKIGEFEYYCSVTDHKTRGMVGKLIVE